MARLHAKKPSLELIKHDKMFGCDTYLHSRYVIDMVGISSEGKEIVENTAGGSKKRMLALRRNTWSFSKSA